jgi:hypothetical protein
MTKYDDATSISDLNTKHRERVQKLESEGKRIDRQTCFAAFADLWEKETALV